MADAVRVEFVETVETADEDFSGREASERPLVEIAVLQAVGRPVTVGSIGEIACLVIEFHRKLHEIATFTDPDVSVVVDLESEDEIRSGFPRRCLDLYDAVALRVIDAQSAG